MIQVHWVNPRDVTLKKINRLRRGITYEMPVLLEKIVTRSTRIHFEILEASHQYGYSFGRKTGEGEKHRWSKQSLYIINLYNYIIMNFYNFINFNVTCGLRDPCCRCILRKGGLWIHLQRLNLWNCKNPLL